jgi:hypothetical protein
MQDGALDHALEAQRRLGVDLVVAGDGGRVLVDEVGSDPCAVVRCLAPQARSLGCRGVVEQRQQQVLDGDELVALLPRLDKGHVQADFQFLRNHSVFLHDARQRVLVLRAKLETCSTLVAATSRG